MTHSVEVLPLQIVLTVEDGETIMETAEQAGWRWPTLCHGDCSCSVCWFEVVEGTSNLAPPSAEEQQTLQLLPLHRLAGKEVRLACRARVLGDLVVRKKGVSVRDQDATPTATHSSDRDAG